MVDFRDIVRWRKVRVAGTPSCYPSLFVFPRDWVSGDGDGNTVPAEDILGYYDMNRGYLTHVTVYGQKMDPKIWLDRNVLRVPESFSHVEKRILQLPAGEQSSDRALETHMQLIFNSIVERGGDGPPVAVHPTPRLPLVPHGPAAPKMPPSEPLAA